MTNDNKTKGRVGLDVDQAVGERYSAAAQAAEPALCCAVQYDQRYLEVLPRELIERDYGCGDPTRYVQPGDTILDLGSGAGKVCYIASQMVGPEGRVIGIDTNDDMLALARKHQQQIGQQIGWHNVRFHKARIQDLALDLEVLEARLRAQPVTGSKEWFALQNWIEQQKREQPMIADGSVDLVLSNCVLNLVRYEDRQALFSELFRVLRQAGRAVISDIVSDREVPEHLRRDPELWSGCVSGAYVEEEFLRAFRNAGFNTVECLERQKEPWRTVEGIEFRSVTVRAVKGTARGDHLLPLVSSCGPGCC